MSGLKLYEVNISGLDWLVDFDRMLTRQWLFYAQRYDHTRSE